MGRRTVASFDDVFSTKFRGVICDVLEKLNDQNEIEHVDSLYPRRTDSDPSSSTSSSSQNQKRNYTFEHFVDHLDETDPTFHNLMELLITITARKAIMKAADLNDSIHDINFADGIQSSPITSSTSSASAALRLESRLSRFNTRTSRECQREVMRSRAVQGEIRGITQRNRRHRRHDESSSSSDSLQSTSPPPTRTVFSTLTSAAPDTTLIGAESGIDMEGATSRIYRVSHPGSGNSTGNNVTQQSGRTSAGAYRWLQRDISSIRRRLDQHRDDNSGRTLGGSENDRASTPIPRRSSGLFYVARDGSHRTVHSSIPASDTDSAFVQRFLTQSFPSDERSPSSGASSASDPSRSTQATSLSSRGGLDSTLAPQLDTSSSRTFTNQSPLISMDDPQSGEVMSMLNALNDADSEPREAENPITSSTEEATVVNPIESNNNTESSNQSVNQGSESRLTAIRAALNRLDEARSRQSTIEEDVSQGLMPLNQNSEFELFSEQRRQESRTRPDLSWPGMADRERDEIEDDEGQARLDRALEVLSRADETLQNRLISSRARVLNSINRNNNVPASTTTTTDNRDPLSRRLERPPTTTRE